MSVDTDISSLLDELHQTKDLGNFVAKRPPPVTQEEIITDDTINEFVLKQSSKIIAQGMDMLAHLQTNVKASGSAEEVEAYSKMYSAVTGSIDALNKVNIQNKKTKSAKELKQIDAEIKSKEPQGNTTNIIVASREEIMERLFERAEEVVDVTPEDTME